MVDRFRRTYGKNQNQALKMLQKHATKWEKISEKERAMESPRGRDIRNLLSSLDSVIGSMKVEDAENQTPEAPVPEGDAPGGVKAPDAPAPEPVVTEPIVGVPEILRMIEADITDEIKAASVYEAQAVTILDTDIKSKILHIASEERTHIKELKEILVKLQGIA